MTAKIALIGAGSAVFSLSLIRDLCLTPNLQGSTVTFMDVDAARLESAHRLCRRFAGEVGIRLELEQTTERRQALEGADFVINTALAAGHARLRAGWEIGRRHGYRIGGSLHIMHDEAFWIDFYQFRLFESIVRDILDICPQAWYLQVANPVYAGITLLGREYSRAKIVGLCHGYRGVYNLASALGLDAGRLTFEIPGVNHFVFLTRLFHDGRDALPLIDAWLAEKSAAHWKECGTSSDTGPKAFDIYRRLGLFPIGDTATPGGGAWPFWYHTSDEVEKQWQEDPQKWYEEYFHWTGRNVSEIERIGKDASARVTDTFRPVRSGEVFIDLVEAIACDLPRPIVVNLPNRGELVPGLPQDVAVEVQALCSGRGVQGIRSSGLPPQGLALIYRERIAPMEMELAAYRQGSRELLLQLVLMDPYTRSLDQARAFLEEILSMPGHEDMRRHYR